MAAKQTEPVTIISLRKLSQAAPEPQQKGKTIPQTPAFKQVLNIAIIMNYIFRGEVKAVGQLVDCLPNLHKVLNLILSTTAAHVYNPT